MTVAQLAQYPGVLARQLAPRRPGRARRIAMAWCPTEAQLWRGIAAGLSLAAAALLLTVLAVEATRTPEPALAHHAAMVGAGPNRLEIYQAPADGNWAMPVP